MHDVIPVPRSVATADAGEATGFASAPSALRPRIERVLARAGVPGCSMAVVDREGIVWADGFGLADLRSTRPARPDTVYHLFSGTKLFTAAAVLRLAESGDLFLDDPVARYVPEAAHLAGVTLLHLLSHRSGLKDSMRGFLAATFPGEPQPSAEEALREYRLVAARPPGARVEYRNVNYALLGVVISRVAGVEYREYVAPHVLAPLGVGCAFSLSDGMRARAATGYIGQWDPMRLVLRALHPRVARRIYGGRIRGLVELTEYELSTAAIGGLVGSVPAFARLLRAQLDGGGGVLREESSRRMQTMVAAGTAGIESRVGVCLGWKVGRVGDRDFLNHEGAGAGFTSELRLYLSEGVGIALAMNVMRMPGTMRLSHVLCEMVRAARE
ncbi:MAG: serine hydrolase domain-containing protein [Gemmatimonadaceae bacterium]